MSIKMFKKSLAKKQGWLTRTTKEGNELIGSNQLAHGKIQRIIESIKEKRSSYQATFNQFEAKLATEENVEGYEQLMSDY